MRLWKGGREALASLALALGLAVAPWQLAAQGSGPDASLPVLHVDNGPNSPAAQQAHYVVLVSLDGFLSLIHI